MKIECIHMVAGDYETKATLKFLVVDLPQQDSLLQN